MTDNERKSLYGDMTPAEIAAYDAGQDALWEANNEPVEQPKTQGDDGECSMCGGVGELEATLADGTRENVACPACLQKQLETANATLTRELAAARKALEGANS